MCIVSVNGRHLVLGRPSGCMLLSADKVFTHSRRICNWTSQFGANFGTCSCQLIFQYFPAKIPGLTPDVGNLRSQMTTSRIPKPTWLFLRNFGQLHTHRKHFALLTMSPRIPKPTWSRMGDTVQAPKGFHFRPAFAFPGQTETAEPVETDKKGYKPPEMPPRSIIFLFPRASFFMLLV